MKKWLFQEATNPTIVTKIIDLMALNLIFILSCLPIITIGASLTSLYDLTLKMADPERDYFLVKDYVKSFKKNFIQSTTAMGVLLLIIAILAGGIQLINLFGQPSMAITLPFLVIIALFGLGVIYVFPLLAYFENNLSHTFRNALAISFQQMAKSILIFSISLIILILLPLFVRPLWFLWLLMAFSLTAYLQSLILLKIFENYAAIKN